MLTEISSLSLRRKPRWKPRIAVCEALEVRALLSATASALPTLDDASAAALVGATSSPVTVTATQIITEADTIPRFAAQPTISTIRSGNWTDPTIWSLGRVPTNGDRVAIAQGMVVTYSTVSNAKIDALEINGGLQFFFNVNTRLTVGTIEVMPSGTLQIGTAANPIAPGVQAEIVIADKPLDLVNDPKQYGNGLIVLGKIDVHGAAANETWFRLAGELHAGDTSLLVSGVTPNWRPGDTLVLPDSRQVLTSDEARFVSDQLTGQWEQVTVDHVQGNRVFLKTALAFDHLGARNTDGGLELLPHVALLNRNVVIRSENPDGVRGHTFYTGRAQVDIEYARFEDLGRTSALADLDNTVVAANGVVTHVGTNQIGRYAVHFHHMLGPENPTNTGYQFKFIGNTVDGSKKWAVAVHDTSFGLLEDNVVYGAEGAGFVTEDGSEVGNVFRSNITMRIQGTHLDGRDGMTATDYGRGGSGFWFRRAGNMVVGNVAADSTFAGFVIDGYFDLDPVLIPTARGVDKHEAGQGQLLLNNNGGLFINNEAYGMSQHGLWIAYPLGNNLLGSPNSLTIYGFKVWNAHHSAVVAYHTDHVLFNQLLVLGNEAAQNRNDTGTWGVDLQAYENRNLVIRNSRIEGVRIGIYAPRNDSSQAGSPWPTIIDNTVLKNYINIVVSPPADNRPSNGNALMVRNVMFTMITDLPVGPKPVSTLQPPANIQMRYISDNSDLTQQSIVRVYNFNQVPGANFQVYYREQASSVIMPQTTAAQLYGREEGMIGSPFAGLTNQANWALYGIATAGGLLPAGASASRSDIDGIVGPIQTAVAAPSIVLVTPWQNGQVNGNQPVRIRYNVNGTLPAGAIIYFSLDGGALFTDFKDGGLYNLARGTHTLRVFIGDVNGNELAGTVSVTRSFFVNVPATTTPPVTTLAAPPNTSLDKTPNVSFRWPTA